MSHERSTPSSSGSKDYVSSPPSFSVGKSRQKLPITAFEQFCMKRSDSTFNALAGATGGLASGIVTCPLDVIKTKLQAQGGFRAQQANSSKIPTNIVYRGMVGTARVIWKDEGLRGMYRGLGPIILGYLPTWAVWFTVYGKSKGFFLQYNDNPNIVNFWSSIVAGASSTMVTNPIWVIKTRLMSQVSRRATSGGARPPWHYKSTFDAAKKMYQTEGILSFYSGLTPALLGLTHVAIQFPAYEYLKRQFTGQGMGMTAEGDAQSHWFGVLSASVLSKILASSATYPHEVIRTRLQTQQRSIPSSSSEYAAFRGGLEGSENHGASAIVARTKAMVPQYKGIVKTAKKIYQEETWRAFYAGMGTNMMRAVPAATTTLLMYEFLMTQFHTAKSEGLEKSAESR
ncbi:mitochondrial folate transporter-like protein/carrier [Bisporella sp. PMI_857]|nr:mitochondrial folate transporter-like protein/carrier [Bisporella sp. PMI_857]